MSKHETPLTRQFWHETGGTLIEEFMAVEPGPDRARRLIDGVILLDGPFERRTSGHIDLSGRHLVCIQTKSTRLGMSLLGQALFSARLLEAFQPASIRTVAICTRGDAVLEPLARDLGIDVEIYPAAG